MLFLELGVHEVEWLAKLGGTVLECLFEQVASTFELFPAVAPNKLGKVDIPNLKSDGEVEKLDTSFIDLE